MPVLFIMGGPPEVPTMLGLEGEIYLEADTLSELYTQLSTWSETSNRLFDADGQLRRFMVAYLNDVKLDKQAPDYYQTPLKDGDTLLLMPAICSLFLQVVLDGLGQRESQP